MSVTHSIDVWLEQVSDSLKHAVAGWQFIVGESLSRVDLSHTQGERTALFVSLLSFFFCFVKRRGYELNTIFGTHTHTQWVKGTYLLKTCSVQQAQNIEVKTLNQGFHLKMLPLFCVLLFLIWVPREMSVIWSSVDGPEVTQCSWQDVKIPELLNFLRNTERGWLHTGTSVLARPYGTHHFCDMGHQSCVLTSPEKTSLKWLQVTIRPAVTPDSAGFILSYWLLNKNLLF